jgi:beta-glucosidase
MSVDQGVGKIIDRQSVADGRRYLVNEHRCLVADIDVLNKPLYPFGHGLSYTSFEYSELTLNSSTVRMDEQLRVNVSVKNTGKVAGEEVVQLYIRDLIGSRSRPVKELSDFKKVHIKPNDQREVIFEIESDDLAFWTADEEFAAEPGEFEVMDGRSAADIHLTNSFKLRD